MPARVRLFGHGVLQRAAAVVHLEGPGRQVGIGHTLHWKTLCVRQMPVWAVGGTYEG